MSPRHQGLTLDRFHHQAAVLYGQSEDAELNLSAVQRLDLLA